MNGPLVIAHRGGFGPYEENTLEALRHALQKGCEALEIDVRFDHLKKRFYLEHDFIHSPRKNRENIMTKILSALPAGPIIIVELKSLAWLRKYYVKSFLKEYRKLLEPENSIVISFNPFVLAQLRKLAPDIKIGYLMGNILWRFIFKIFFHRLIQPQYLLVNKRILRLSYIRFARKKGYRIFSFVLNDELCWQKALDYGIDGIITDKPTELNAFLRKKGYNQA
jgi:glycerophosphoryl diester phosphodiesterase